MTLASVGFDAYRGLYHQPSYGRPALALDLMEPFRPLLADSVVVQAINNGEVRPTDFKTVAGSVNLGADGRRRFISTFERRLGHEVVHPLFGYRVSYRRLMEMQARLFGRFLLGELPEYPNFTTRDPMEHLYIVVYDIGDPKRWRPRVQADAGLRRVGPALGLPVPP